MTTFMQRVQSAFGDVRARLDGWVNLAASIGTTSGRLGGFRFQANDRIDDTTLEAMYDGDGYAARIVDALPRYALRKPFVVSTGEAAMDTAISSQIDSLALRRYLLEAWSWGRLFGGALLWVGADDGRAPVDPLDYNNIRSIRFLSVHDRCLAMPVAYFTDPLHPDFGTPSLYRIEQQGARGSGSAIVHASRLVRFGGVLTTRRQRVRNNDWDNSVLQRVWDKLLAFNAAYANGGTLLADASQGVYKIKGLMEMMAGSESDLLQRRLMIMDQSRSIARAVLLDAEMEDFSRVETSLTGLPDVIDRFALYLAGVAEMPVTVLMGRSPAGMNATGEADITLWYATVGAEQGNYLQPRLERVMRMLLRAKNGPTGGVEPKDWKLSFASLYDMTPKETAELRKITADTDKTYIDAQVVTPEEVATSRFRPEGWSAEMVIDLEARAAATENASPSDAPKTDATTAITAIAKPIIDAVAAREMPRATGVVSLMHDLGDTDPARAESILGDVGVSFFTKPDPAAVNELEMLRTENARLTRSQRSTQQMLTRVLERNRNGELVVGNVFAGPPSETEVGDVLEEGDTIAVPADMPAGKTLDSRRVLRADGKGVAVLLPVRWETVIATGMVPTVPAQELHLTLAYLPDGETLDASKRRALEDLVHGWAQRAPRLEGTIAQLARFPGDDGRDAIVLLVECPALHETREALARLLEANGIVVASDYAFNPHITIAYVPSGAGAATATALRRAPVTFREVAVWQGDKHGAGYDLAGAP